MPTVVAGNVAIDVNTPEVGALAWGEPVTATASLLSLRYELWLDTFTGSFQYNALGQLAGGSITGWKQTYNGQLMFEVTGANVPVSQFLTWVANDDDATAVRTIFAGADNMTGSQFGDILSGHAGDDVLMGGGGDDSLEGGAGVDFVRGEAGNDSLFGGDAFDDLHGNMGDDTVIGGKGGDWVVGGQGNDILVGGDLVGADDPGDDVVYGNLGNDTQLSGGGNDWIRGGQGNDSLSAGAGNDLIWGDRGDDTIQGGLGADIFSIFGEGGSDFIWDFTPSEGDRLRVEPGYTYTVAQVGSDVVVTLSGGGAKAILFGWSLYSIGDGWII